MSVTGGIMAGIGAAGALGGAAISSNAAGNAASAQAAAAEQAAQLQHQDAQSALQFQKDQWTTQQQNQAPWLNAGKEGLTSLTDLLGVGPDKGSAGYGSLGQGFNEQFQAPTDVTQQNDPGYQFRLKQGQDALTNSAAARGGLLSGNTAKALEDYTQNSASNEYGNVYARALGQYQQRYNIFKQNQADLFNRYSAVSGTGQVAASQLGQEGQAAAGNMGNILLGSGAQIGGDIQNAAAARASGYVGAANAWGGAFGSGTNNLQQLLMLNQMNQAANQTTTTNVNE